jgi:hypothetical protein
LHITFLNIRFEWYFNLFFHLKKYFMPQLKPKPAYLKPKASIAKEVAEYRTVIKKQSVLSQIIGKEETKSIWFSFNQIQEMWEELIYQTVGNKKDVSGVRVYLTSYLSGSTFAKQMGIVFVLTENVGSAATPKHKDFFIEEQSDYRSRPEPLVSAAELTMLGLDHGTPCPPDCSGGQDPEWP